MKYLFEAPPARRRRAAQSMNARLLDFCRAVLGGKCLTTPPASLRNLGGAARVLTALV